MSTSDDATLEEHEDKATTPTFASTKTGSDVESSNAVEASSWWSSRQVVRSRRRLRRWLTVSWPLLLVLAASVGVAGVTTLLHGPAMSPIDEWVYTDYLDRVPTDGIIRKGDYIEPPALERVACDGVVSYGKLGPPCGSNSTDVSQYPFMGQQTADLYTPAFFWVTWLAGFVIWKILPVELLTAWRLTGTLWLGATLVAMWRLFRAWRLSSFAFSSVSMLLVGSTYTYWTYSYVSTDAPAALFGAVMLLKVTQWMRGASSPWVLVGLSVLAVIFKAANVLAVGMVVAIMLFHGISQWLARRPGSARTTVGPAAALSGDKAGPRRHLLWASVIAGAAGVVQVGWIIINRAIALGKAPGQGVETESPPRRILALTTRFLQETISSNHAVVGGEGVITLIELAFLLPQTWILVAGVVGSVLLLRRRDRVEEPDRWAMVLGIGVSSVLAAPALAILVIVSTGAYYDLPPRYGGMLLPGFMLLAGFILKGRLIAVGVLTYAVGLALYLVSRATLYGH